MDIEIRFADERGALFALANSHYWFWGGGGLSSGRVWEGCLPKPEILAFTERTTV